jgi:site-specific DNA-methyltransferase (adenine-specific)
VIPDTLKDLKVPIAGLKLYGKNPRRGNAIAESLQAHGQYKPIVARTGTNEVLAGNHTLRAAWQLGWTEIAATFVDVDDETAARIVLVDNRASDLGTYDDGALAELLDGLEGLEGTGYDQHDLDRLLDEQLGKDAGRDTEPGPVPARAKTRRGDVWQLGQHRLVCGDATDLAAVSRLFDDTEQAEMVWTDPPYAVAYEDSAGRTITNDELGDDAHYDLLRSALEVAHTATEPGGAIYLMAGSSLVGPTALRDAGWSQRSTLIWVKDSFVLNRQDYHWQHEPIAYGWKPGAGHRWHGGFGEKTVVDDDALEGLDRNALAQLVRDLQNERNTTVVREAKPARSELHPTMKPVALVARQIANSSQRSDIVYDPFAGSGSTLIAADNLARRCYAVELERGFCDVIVDRWERHTGGKASRAKT